MKNTKLNCQKGSLTVDFLFAITLIMGLAAVLLSFSLTLTAASITQYMTFVSARTLFAADHRTQDQVDNAQNQYRRVYNNPVFAPLFSGGWFSIDETPLISAELNNIDQIPYFNDVSLGANDPRLFIGAYTRFVARILDFNIPFYGSTSNTGGDGSGFLTNISTFLSKEPSAVQCENLGLTRWPAIQQLNVPSGSAEYNSISYTVEYYGGMNDNGC